MVNRAKNVSSLTGNGFHDWVLQRLTAIILLIYTPIIIGFFLLNPSLDYATFVSFFDQFWFKLLSFLTILSISAHAWIGLWTISTDYMPYTPARVVFQIFYVIALFAFTVWSFDILWRL